MSTTQKNFNLDNITGRPVIAYTSSKSLKGFTDGYVDMQTLAQVYHDDPDRTHLGLVDLAANISTRSVPNFYRDFWKNYTILEVEGPGSSVTYSTPVTTTGTMTTLKDTSDVASNASSEEFIPVVLSEQLKPGVGITWDEVYGQQFRVAEDMPITPDGDGWMHWVQLYGDNGVVDGSKFKAGVEWMTVGHSIGEYGEQLASVRDRSNTVGTLTSEFVLGNHRGVEAAYTQYAGMRRIPGNTVGHADISDRLREKYNELGKDKKGNTKDMFAQVDYAKDKSGKYVATGKVTIGSLLEMLVLDELSYTETVQLMYQKGGLVQTSNGVVRLNEGKIPQMRRGKIIEYANRIRRNHFREASSYVFQGNREIDMAKRKMLFEGGWQAVLQTRQLFREEFMNQMLNMPGLGTDRVLPSSPVTGKLDALEIKPVLIETAPIQDLGMVTVKHDPAYDYSPVSTRNSGYRGQGFSHQSYSLVMEDFTSPKYSNVADYVKGANLIEGGLNSQTMYYIKPEGPAFWWGYTLGRWDDMKSSNIYSSLKQMGKEIWAHSISACLILDPTRYVIIEQRP